MYVAARKMLRGDMIMSDIAGHYNYIDIYNGEHCLLRDNVRRHYHYQYPNTSHFSTIADDKFLQYNYKQNTDCLCLFISLSLSLSLSLDLSFAGYSIKHLGIR